MRLLWLADTLRKAGLPVEEHPGWQTRGKDGYDPKTKVDYSMRPRVVIGHHTAAPASTSESVINSILVSGRPDLPGPLCHLRLKRNGAYRIIAAGKANHAGAGRWEDANESVETIGIEADNWGNGVPFPTREPWPQVQLDAYDRGVAALLDQLGRDQRFFCGHREWATPPGRKPDPSGIDLPAMRVRIGTILREGDTLIIRPGARGNYVKPYQTMLNNWAVTQAVPNWTPVVADGIFGVGTTSAVTRYQTDAEIKDIVPQVGALDDLTRDLLTRFA